MPSWSLTQPRIHPTQNSLSDIFLYALYITWLKPSCMKKGQCLSTMHCGQQLWVQGSQWNAFGDPSNLLLPFHPQISLLGHWHPFPWPPSPIQEE